MSSGFAKKHTKIIGIKQNLSVYAKKPTHLKRELFVDLVL